MSKLSIGGMGTVYKAEHKLIGKHAAVKVLHPELSTNQELINRFFNEAKATTSIKHPGIVEVFDFGYMDSGHAYLVMEFLEGASLARRLKQKTTMLEGEAAMILRAVCNALAAAHAKGIIHRDLKPDNIFLVPDPESPSGERPKILDFGIAKLTEPGLAGEATKTGAVMGTPTYMSPEQCRGTGNVDHRADIYSIGCIFYELVCGEPPFSSLGAGELLGMHLYVEPESPKKHCKTLSANGEKLIMALLSKKPERRVQTAKELAQRLANLAQELGWITASSPTGVTAQALAELPKIESPEAYMPTTATPAGAGDDSSPLLTPGFLAAITGDEPEPQKPDKPTTLSGAASVSEIDAARKRSRVGIGIGLAAAVLAGVGAFAFVKITNEEPHAAAAKPVVTPQPKPEPPPPPPVAAPAPVPAAPPQETTPPPAPEVVPTPVETAPATADKPADKPKTVRRTTKPPAKPPAKPPEKKPPEKKPDQQQPPKNPLIETDL